VYLDPERPVAKLDVQGREFVLQQGDWSDWIRVEFKALPLFASVSAIARFYLKQVRPEFELYVTPLQINPENPGGMQISTPKGWSHELCEEMGYFYTQELPEDTKALTYKILNGHEFWQQAQFVYDERQQAFDHIVGNWKEGLLFFYFSSVDQNSHMLWNYMDPEHPGHTEDELLVEGIRTVYRELDDIIGRALEVIDEETTFIVMSDHGFAPFYWQVNLNTWLAEKGYAVLDPSRSRESILFGAVDWSRTKAYALGLNGLYVNLRGRERRGIVNPGEEHERLLARLEQDLLEMVDPRNGRRAVSLVVNTRRDFHGPLVDSGPDLLVGYSWGYRSSWSSPLGEYPQEIFVDNEDAWSGDHSMDYRLVPGVLISNRPITLDEPALYDLTVAVLDEYGVEKPPEMIGRDCLGDR
jgi:predicted AlkP superfamily phosphohydrolase/phosphomutase